jgi:septal ring factor EnvC (AmiA/AmiB activator)
MPFGESPVHGAPSLTSAPFAAFAAAAVLLFAGSGCIVTGATYEMKAKEADSLREAMTSLNRDRGKLAEENAALGKQVAAGKETEAALSARLAEKDEALKRLSEELAACRKMCEEGREPRSERLPTAP